jgi:hypothetical protein
MNKDIIDRPLIDPNLSSYEKFFDHAWARSTFAAVKDTPLEDAVNALVMAWRSTNGAHILPSLMVECLRQFAEGEMDGNLRARASYSEKVVNGLSERIESLMKDKLSPDQRRSLRQAVAQIEEKAHAAIKTAREQVQLDVTGYWNFLVNASEFQFSILGTQRINYGSLFFAYEDFLANVIRTKEPTYSSKKEPIKAAFARNFGDPLADFCWNHDEVDLARLVRNALAHNGGRFGKDLEKYTSRFTDATETEKVLLRGDSFNLVDGKIQITPDNTTYLFGVLKQRVTRIIEELVGPAVADTLPPQINPASPAA